MTQARWSNSVMLKHPPKRDGDICAARAAWVPECPKIGFTPVGAADRRCEPGGERGQTAGWDAGEAAWRKSRRLTNPITRTPAEAV